jgi:hypothetical protein
MRPWLIVLILAATPLLAGGLHAAVFEEYDDFTFLRAYETVRYKALVDYGTGDEINMRVYVRGLDASPRVRVLDEDRRVIANRRAGSSWILDFDITGFAAEGSTYYFEVTHRYGSSRGYVDVNIQLEAPQSQGASGSIVFDRYFFDRDRGRVYIWCAATQTGGWPLAGLALLAASALWFRRRTTTA